MYLTLKGLIFSPQFPQLEEVDITRGVGLFIFAKFILICNLWVAAESPR